MNRRSFLKRAGLVIGAAAAGVALACIEEDQVPEPELPSGDVEPSDPPAEQEPDPDHLWKLDEQQIINVLKRHQR